MNDRNVMDVENKKTMIQKLRKRIYIIESQNLHKKNPKKDSEIVEDIIRVIHQTVEEER